MAADPHPDRPARLVITAGVHHRDPRPLTALAGGCLVAFLLLLALTVVPGLSDERNADGMRIGTGLALFWFLVLLPVAAWRYVTILDREHGKVIRWSGFTFWRRPPEELDLARFTAVHAGVWKQTAHTLGGEVVPDFISGPSGGWVPNVDAPFHRVFLSDGGVSLDLQEFFRFPGAWRLVGTVADFLGLPGPPRPTVRARALPLALHVVLHDLAFWFGGLFGAGGAVVVIVVTRGGGLPGEALGALGMAALLAGFALGSFAVRLLPARCLRCGGRTYRCFRAARKVGYGYYLCSGCGLSHRP